MKYELRAIPYEFRTNKGEQWTGKDIISYFNETVNSYDSSLIKEFGTYEEAKAYIASNKVSAPYESPVCGGYVVTGEIWELDELDEDGEVVNVEMFCNFE